MTYSDEQIFDALGSYFVQQGIVGQGLIDSLGIFKLIAFVEEKFAITVEPDEVLLENFQTPRALRNLIVKKLSGAGQTQAAR